MLLGQPELAVHSARALEIYEELGNFDRQAQVLNNLGGFAYYEGRWDDAVALYERGREIRLRTGNAVEAAFIACNIGEVLTDQGHLDEAEARFRDALRVARAAEEAVRRRDRAPAPRPRRDAGRRHRARRSSCLDEARAQFEAMRNADDVAGGRRAARRVPPRRRRPGRARSRSSRRSAPRTRRGSPTLERTRGQALLALGDDDGARAALEVSLADARDQDALYEIARTLDALVDLDVRAGDLALGRAAREPSAPSCSGRLGVRVDPERRISLIEPDSPSSPGRRRHPGTDAGRPGGPGRARNARQGGPGDPSKNGWMSTRQKTINGYRIEPFANLQGAQLQRARLGGMNLYCVNFRGADLSEADLRGAYLAEAQLSGALLTACDMSGANLSGATLQRAMLNGVDLTEANLRNADLGRRPDVRRGHPGREVLQDGHA